MSRRATSRRLRRLMLLPVVAALFAWTCRNYGFYQRDDLSVLAGLDCAGSGIAVRYLAWEADRQPIRAISFRAKVRTSWLSIDHHVEVGNLSRFHNGLPW
jgi:hypothetical protein